MAIRLTPRLKYPFPDFLTGDEEIVRPYWQALLRAKLGVLRGN